MPRPLTQLPINEVIHAYTESRQTLTTIAARYGVSPNTIRSHLHRAGIATDNGPARTGALPVSVKVSAYLLSEGYNLSDIARLFGVDAETVAEVIAAPAVADPSPQPTTEPEPEPEPAATSAPEPHAEDDSRTTGQGYLYIAQAAEEFGIDLRRLRQWAESGHVRTLRPAKGPRRYHRADIARMAAAPSQDTGAPEQPDHDRPPEPAAPAAAAQPPATRTDHAPELLTTREVAERFRVDMKTVGQWVDRGYLTAVRTLGGRGHHRIPRAEVERLLHGPDPDQADTTSPQEDATG